MNISIKNYPVNLKIGHFNEEKNFSRTVFVSLNMMCQKTKPTDLENLKKTVDYSKVIVFLEKEFTDKSYDLIETLIYQLAGKLLQHFKLIQKISLKVEKTFMDSKLTKGSTVSIEEYFNRDDNS